MKQSNGASLQAVGIELSRKISEMKLPKWSHIMFDMTITTPNFDENCNPNCQDAQRLNQLWTDSINTNTKNDPYYSLTVFIFYMFIRSENCPLSRRLSSNMTYKLLAINRFLRVKALFKIRTLVICLFLSRSFGSASE